jgi:hypothetical protein
MRDVKPGNWLLAVAFASLLAPAAASAQGARPAIDVDKARVVDFWTPERQREAIPRDLVIDSRGLGYLRRADGTLVPYGHNVPAEKGARAITPMAKPGGSTTGGTIGSAEWKLGGAVQKAAGRLLFQMSDGYYVCSGSVVTDGTTGRSLILTAAHCVYDDVYKAFATNVLFIPDQAHTTRGSKTDFNCGNDPYGCWVPSFGAVDKNWTLRTFPDNIPWDYAFYVVSDTGAHSDGSFDPNAVGFSGNENDVLDVAVGSLEISFADPSHDVSGSSIDYTYALGYSYSNDPKFMYCAQDMSTNGTANWWLGSCRLSGGSSGGPWVQDGTNAWTGGTDGKIFSVNSWGYTIGAGMAGPKLAGTSASCVFEAAKSAPMTTAYGVDVTCP